MSVIFVKIAVNTFFIIQTKKFGFGQNRSVYVLKNINLLNVYTVQYLNLIS